MMFLGTWCHEVLYGCFNRNLFLSSW